MADLGIIGALNIAKSVLGSDRFSIQRFMAELNQYSDTGRADKFDVVIMPPVSLLGRYPNGAKRLNFQCEGAEVPGKTISTFEVRTYGPQLKFPYQTIFSDLSLTFFCVGNQVSLFGNLLEAFGSPLDISSGDLGLPEKTFFDDWMELINPTPNSIRNGQYNMAYKEDYASPGIQLNHYDVTGTRTYAINFIDAYPIATNPIALSWADDSIMRLTVSFAYTRWERITNVFNQDDQASIGGDILSTAQIPNIGGILGSQVPINIPSVGSLVTTGIQTGIKGILSL